MASCWILESLNRLMIAALSVLLVGLPVQNLCAQDATPTQPAAVQSPDSGSSTANAKPEDSEPLPDSPSATQQPSSGTQEASQSSQQPAPPPQQKAPQRQEPVGTAAAGVENTAGIAASKPAGVAIAPPKQRRVRQLIIKLGVIAGAGAALGTVMALSKASPSKPPGTN
jgi:cytoskeletal protein RodZ